MRVFCPKCAVGLKSPKIGPGAHIRCPKCKTEFTIPAETNEPAEATRISSAKKTNTPSATVNRSRGKAKQSASASLQSAVASHRPRPAHKSDYYKRKGQMSSSTKTALFFIAALLAVGLVGGLIILIVHMRTPDDSFLNLDESSSQETSKPLPRKSPRVAPEKKQPRRKKSPPQPAETNSADPLPAAPDGDSSDELPAWAKKALDENEQEQQAAPEPVEKDDDESNPTENIAPPSMPESSGSIKSPVDGTQMRGF